MYSTKHVQGNEEGKDFVVGYRNGLIVIECKNRSPGIFLEQNSGFIVFVLLHKSGVLLHKIFSS